MSHLLECDSIVKGILIFFFILFCFVVIFVVVIWHVGKVCLPEIHFIFFFIFFGDQTDVAKHQGSPWGVYLQICWIFLIGTKQCAKINQLWFWQYSIRLTDRLTGLFFPLYVHCCDDLDRIHLEWPVRFGTSNFKRAFVLLVKKQSIIIKVQL